MGEPDVDEKSIAFARYWRNSLADADLGTGAFQRTGDVKDFIELRDCDSLPLGHVDRKIVDRYFEGEPREVETVGVVIRPRVYIGRGEHGKLNDQLPAILTPLITPAKLDREGRLYPESGTLLARDVLEPLQRGAYSIGSVAGMDSFLATDAVPGVVHGNESPFDPDLFDSQWRGYLAGCEQLMSQVCPQWPGLSEPFELAKHGFLVKKESVRGASRHIIALYDHLIRHRPKAPLFDRYADERIAPAETCLAPNAGFAARLAHSSDRYPLAAAQRDALSHQLANGHGQMLAVNGPPGTGKTTLLLSIVATLWARSALEGTEPSVIVASSTNNQAVTNILDAFERDFSIGSGPFAGRWLPNVKSFGAYLPSTRKEKEQSGKYQTRSFFDEIESQDYVDAAMAQYLAAAKQALPSAELATVGAIVDALQQRIRQHADELAAIEAAWPRLVEARAAVSAELGSDPAVAQAQRYERMTRAESQWRIVDQLKNNWDAYLARESIFYSLFAWLPPVATKRWRRAQLFLKQSWPAQWETPEWRHLNDVETTINAWVDRYRQDLAARKAEVGRGEAVLEVQQVRLGEWSAASVPLAGIDVIDAAAFDLNDADRHADTAIRFEIFRLATHYWEGRWLLEMIDLLPSIEIERPKNGRAAIERRWRRRMKLTPCIVSTFFMLPAELQISGRNYVKEYLYGFADLLIVDEAGQVLPEVAGASFALAKTALVIGDILQIEPIWSIPKHVDIGNLRSLGLISMSQSIDAEYESMGDSGKTVASGSVMRIAQCASRWHYDAGFERGMMLYEHRRCVDEIIGYCNDLCYGGKLIPKRGGKAEAENTVDDGLPALGYLHVDGICRSGSGGSRENQTEAEAVAAWLADRKSQLEEAYGKPLCEIVGVITPFAGQVRAITRACDKAGITVGTQPGEMTIGTVHSLQGAERPLVIFSAVYSKHADGGFIDQRASMLNVAVSRAKNTFLVFGDMDVFALVPRSKPRGLLAAMLLADDSHELKFPLPPRRDLRTPRTGLTQLRDAPEHDSYLQHVLERATREVHIVTPWIRLDCVEKTGAMQAMAAAIARGVKVRVYTDRSSNTSNPDAVIRARKTGELAAALDALRAQAIEPIVVHKVHSKIVIGDDDNYCVGSFNWFSARRDEGGMRHETSLAYHGPELTREIDAMKVSLRLRAIG